MWTRGRFFFSFSCVYGKFLEYRSNCWPLKNIMRYFRFEIQVAVRFRIRYCNSWHRVVLSYHTNASSIFRDKINSDREWLVYVDTLQGMWSLRSVAESGQRKSGQSQQQMWAENMRAAEVKLNFHLNQFCPENGSSMFTRTVGAHSVSTMNAAVSGTAIPRPLSVPTRQVTGRSVPLPLTLSRFLQATILYAVPPLCCSWLHIPACCPNICNHCAMLYVEPPTWGVSTRSVFWRGHRQTLKSFKVVCGHYYDKIWYDIFVNCNWVDTRWQ